MRESGIPENHPLRLYFLILTEKNFHQKLNWADPFVSEYISNLLLYFTRTDAHIVFCFCQDSRVDTVAEM